MKLPSRAEIERLRKQYPAGTVVEVISMEMIREYGPLVLTAIASLFAAILIVKSTKTLIRVVKQEHIEEKEQLRLDTGRQYRVVNGFVVKLDSDAQDKCVPGRGSYEKARDMGNLRSIIFRDEEGLQKLLDEKAGTGDFVATNKEKVDFGVPIGQYVNPENNSKLETTIGVIHYTEYGAYIVPARPGERRLADG